MPLFDLKDKARYAVFSRRTLLMGGGITSVFTLLGLRLYQLQIIEGQQYAAEAEENRINQRLIEPARGTIYDRFAIALADGRRSYRILLIPEQAENGVAEALNALGKIIQMRESQRDAVLRNIRQGKPFVPVLVSENISWDAFARVSMELPYLPGIVPDATETRDYPFASEFSHVLGYVAAVGPEDIEKDHDPLLDLPGFRIGKRGIEKQFDAQIRGRGGIDRTEVNAYGRAMRDLSRAPSTPGQDVYLTIDRTVQDFVHQRLGDESAACAVMDVESGDVIALSSKPDFDPNLFNTGITRDQWRELVTNDHAPMTNKALTGLYPPGSTFKPATALAAIDAGIVKPGYSVFCTGALRFGNHDFHCWRKGGHGRLDLHEGIKYSCDVFFYETALRAGIGNIALAANALGLGLPTGIELPGERGGLIPTPAWKRAVHGTTWLPSETLMAGIGQGYVLATPLQLCTFASRIASGKAVSPRIAHMVGNVTQPRPPISHLSFSDDALAMVRSGMSAVTNELGGTAYAWRIPNEGFEMAGKTGTAQVRAISRAEHAHGVRKDGEVPWKLRDHALFIAYAPVDRPRYACSVIIEHGSTVSHEQVQMARDILLFTQKRDPSRLRPNYPLVSATGFPQQASLL